LHTAAKKPKIITKPTSYEWQQIRGKSYLHPADTDYATVRDLVRFIKKISQIHPEVVITGNFRGGDG